MNEQTPVPSISEYEKILFLCDLALFTKTAENLSNIEIYEFLQSLYREIESEIKKSKGIIVKHMGDSTLAVFDPTDLKETIAALKELKIKIQMWLQETKFRECKFRIKLHLGSVVESKIGEPQQYDIFGKAVHELFKIPFEDFKTSAAIVAKLW